MTNLTRRALLTTTAAGAAAIGLGASTGFAFATTNSDAMGGDVMGNQANCPHNHHALGHKLSTLISDPTVDDTVKNHAIKTASCPSCGTGIAPTGLGLAASTWN